MRALVFSCFVLTACSAPMTPDAGPRCAAPTGAPVEHNGSRIVADETWAASSIHLVSGTIGIGTGATVTIEPCAQVRMKVDSSIIVSGVATPNTGTLIAEGDADRPITFVPDNDAAPWSVIEVRGGGSLRLAHVTIRGGGAGNGPFSDASLRIYGDQNAPPQELARVRNVTITDSKNYGVFLGQHGTFTSDSTNLTVTNSAKAPIMTWASSLGNLPTGGTFTGNNPDEIGIRGGGGAENVATNTTMKNLGVPYRVGTAQSNNAVFNVSSGVAGTVATLTIEAGTTIKFERGATMQLEPSTGTNASTAALVAVGTASAPIVFTSAEAAPAAGNWVGLWFGQTPSALNRIDYATVEFAGGTTGTQGFSCNMPGRDEAAILILGEPASGFVTNTTIRSSARHGIDRGWRGAVIDFMATNTFENVAGCKQTYPHDTNNGCPMNPPCP
ncbi:MAG: right-handed parallel beta-helix repeat-containing protein [Archangium sp.]|nr:right-handed parallel beta-helix repeat-containing protein [Archangium sp.]